MRLPEPTCDLAVAFDDLAEAGYCLIKDALDPGLLAALRRRVSDQARGEDRLSLGFHDGAANQRIWMLPNKGRVFRDLELHPLVETMMGRLLGPHFLLSSLTANIARPGGAAMVLHSDQGYVDFWTEKPLVANIAWMLDDFSAANGGTRLVPGSHREAERRPYAFEETVAAEGPAGSALVFDGRLAHGTGPNRTAGEERRAILAYHCRPFVRQQENFFLGLDPAVRREASEAFLRRLGFSLWAGLGRVDSPLEKGVIAPVAAPTPALGADGAVLVEA